MAFDAIVVPGGGLRQDNDGLPEHVKRRFDLALARESGEPIVALSAWTTHRPSKLDADGRVLFESLTGARYLIDHGIRPERIFCESTSYDTIGNAYFSRLQIVEPMRWKRLLVVTSEFHIARTEAIFRWVYSLDARWPYTFEFAASSNEGITPAAMAARRTHEETSLRSVKQLRKRLNSLRAMAEWLFTEHKAYHALRQKELQDSADLLGTY